LAAQWQKRVAGWQSVAVLALVDLDGTIVDRDAAFARWLQIFAEAYRLTPQQRAWAGEWDQQTKERGRFFGGLVEHLSLDVSASQVWADYRTAMPTLTTAFPGVEHALRNLKSIGWQLVVLTNGQVDNQIGKLRSTGLLDLFDACRVSGQTGLRKPDSQAFLEALATVGYVGPRETTWMIGDDPVLDVAGAQDVGLCTAWITHGRSWPTEQPSPTVTAPTPAEALQHVAELIG
jgi:putative hydrolase of the HAD superfamily